MPGNRSLALFEGKEIRKIWDAKKEEWFFSIIDIIAILGVSNREPRKYWSDLKKKLIDEGYTEVSENIGQLKMKSSDNKMRLTDVANTRVCLRIIQSIPSRKAEPLKKWLAQVGDERVKEIDDPEKSMQRMLETYEKKGYPQEWIDIRMRGIPVRKGLTNEWDKRGGSGVGYGILTNEVYKAYTGMDNMQWKNFKGVKKGNLRDTMTPTELILTMLAEQATTDITQSRDSKGLPELKKSAKDGGGVAMKARKELQQQTGADPISEKNFLEDLEERKKLQ